MNLPGQPFTATVSDDLCLFLQAICNECRHQEYCSILAHAGMYGGASEWRTVDGKPACIRQEGLPVVEMCTECNNAMVHRNGCLECPVCGSGCEG